MYVTMQRPPALSQQLLRHVEFGELRQQSRHGVDIPEWAEDTLKRGATSTAPVVATANSLFEQRIAPSAADFFGSDDKPSIALAHGNSDYALKRMRAKHAERMRDGAPEAGTITTDLDAWANDSAKTVLLCDFGVGTVDQVALAGLPIRHVVLRQLGLARKVLVIDEAHASRNASSVRTFPTCWRCCATNGQISRKKSNVGMTRSWLTPRAEASVTVFKSRSKATLSFGRVFGE